MTLEVRYIMFAPEEVRRAVTAFALKEGYADTPDDILTANINSEVQDAVSMNVQVRRATTNRTINISSEHLIGAMLLYCRAHRIPVPSRAQKKIERSSDGLTLVLTTDLHQKKPVVAHDHVAYTGIANYAQESSEARRELVRAIERAETAKAMITLANRRAQAAETAAAESAARLTMIVRAPGLRGWLGRWLLGSTFSVSGAGPRRIDAPVQ
jgi:hypothetical protein